MKGPRYLLWLAKVRYLKWRAAFIVFAITATSGLVAYGSWQQEVIRGDWQSHLEIRGDLKHLTPERINEWVRTLGSPPEKGWRAKDLIRSLSDLPWVRQASVKILPGYRITIWIDEAKPIALVLLDKLYYLNESGSAFEAVKSRESVSFPVISGFPPEEWSRIRSGDSLLSAEAAQFLSDWNGDPDLAGLYLSEMRWNEAVGWVAYLIRPPVQVVLGQGLNQGSVYRFARVWGAVQRQGKEPSRIDLDYSDRAVVKWSG